jgi:hypothetical protein
MLSGKGLGKKLIEKAVEVSWEEFQKDKAAGEQGACLVFVSKATSQQQSSI